MSELIEKYISDERYQAVCYELLTFTYENDVSWDKFGYTSNPIKERFSAEYLKEDAMRYLIGKKVSKSLYSYLGEEDKQRYLVNLSESERAMLRLSQKEILSHDDVINSLKSADSSLLFENILQANPLNYQQLEVLLASKKPKTLTFLAYHLQIAKEKDSEWFKLASDDALVGLDGFRKDFLLASPETIVDILKNFTQYSYCVRTNCLSLMPPEALVELLKEDNLLTFKTKSTAIQKTRDYNKIKYVSLLIYYAEKNNLKVDSGFKSELDDLYHFFVKSNTGNYSLVKSYLGRVRTGYRSMRSQTYTEYLQYLVSEISVKRDKLDELFLVVEKHDSNSYTRAFGHQVKHNESFTWLSRVYFFLAASRGNKFKGNIFDPKYELYVPFTRDYEIDGKIENKIVKLRNKYIKLKYYSIFTVIWWANDPEEIEKIILVFSYFGPGELDFLFFASKNLDLEQTKTAISLVSDWPRSYEIGYTDVVGDRKSPEGTKLTDPDSHRDFIQMVRSI